MKTAFHIILVCALFNVMTSCGNEYHRKKVEQYVLEAQQVTPMQVDQATVLASVEIDGDDVVYRYIIDESMITIEAFSQQEGVLRNEFDDRRMRDPSMDKFVNEVAAAHMRIVMVYQGNLSHNTYTLSFPTEQLGK